MSRGNLNTKIIEMSKKFMGRIITMDELRLLPYIDYILKNEGNINRERINKIEYEILISFSEKQYITLSDDLDEDGYKNKYFKITCKSKEFYMFMQEVLYESYVIKESEKNEKES